MGNFDRFCGQNLKIMSANYLSFWGDFTSRPPGLYPQIKIPGGGTSCRRTAKFVYDIYDSC